MSPGVRMTCKSGFINAMLTAVNATDMMTDNTAALPTVWRIAFMSPAPNFCAVSTVNPALIPQTNPRTKNIMVPVLPTAASAFVPTNFPTITVSAIL